jgi:two-component system, cell cycle sensor histidine kinase and response regulator CckA
VQIAAGLALLMLLGTAIYRQVATPIRRLSRSVREASGRDAPKPVPVSGPSEVRELAEDVNSLTEAVHRELEERRRSEARYRDLFENASDLIATLDLEGRLTAVNAAFVRTTGYSRVELIGKPLAELVPDDGGDAHPAPAGRPNGDEETTVYEGELLARDGHRIQIEVASRLVFEQGQPVGSEAICRDITERRELEAQLRQAQRLEAVGMLAGGVAHDFNNLLTVISGYTETIREKAERGSEFELAQVAAAAERAKLLTRQLLAFSRRQVLQPRVLHLNEVIEGIEPMLARLIGDDVELSTSLDPELSLVLVDPSQLEQVLFNLVVNARDAMPTGGRLTIQSGNVELDEDYVAHHGESSAGAHVMLAVSDTGHGMDAETLERIFEPFFTTKPVGSGTGLGLATVYGIVKQSGGNVWVYSEPGKGTTFKIYLPVTDAVMAPEVERPTAASATGTETILLAEDDDSLRRLTEILLERRGYAVISARSSEEAVAMAAENVRRIDLLLTDLVMPRLSGAEVAQRVGELVPGIRVLFMSGYADDVVLRSGTLSASDAFLEKPFSANDLATKVRETLDAA